MNNYMELSFPSLRENESFARTVVAAFCLELNPTVEELNDVKTAVSEGVTNAIVHGYNSAKEGIIYLNSKIIDNSIEITIIDNGVGIKDVKKAMEPFFTTKPNEEKSGMGFTIMQTFMDEVNVESSDGETKLILKKSFKRAQDAGL